MAWFQAQYKTSDGFDGQFNVQAGSIESAVDRALEELVESEEFASPEDGSLTVVPIGSGSHAAN
jgi:hypothetical protein